MVEFHCRAGGTVAQAEFRGVAVLKCVRESFNYRVIVQPLLLW